MILNDSTEYFLQLESPTSTHTFSIQAIGFLSAESQNQVVKVPKRSSTPTPGSKGLPNWMFQLQRKKIRALQLFHLTNAAH